MKYLPKIAIFISLFCVCFTVHAQFHLGSISHGDGVTANSAKLDMPTSVYVSDNYAYVTSFYSNALEVIDISDPANPKHASSLSHGEGGALLQGPIAIQISGNYAYIASQGSQAIEVVDISNPLKPKHYSFFSFISDTEKYSIFSVENIYIHENYAYTSVKKKSSLGDFGNTPLLFIIDISNPAALQVKESMNTFNASISIVSGDFLYKSFSSLDVYDNSNPEIPQKINEINFQTPIYAFSNEIEGGYLYICGNSMFGGQHLEIFDLSDPKNPKSVSNIRTQKPMNALVVSGNYVYLTGENSLEVIDISNRKAPVSKLTMALPQDIREYYPLRDASGLTRLFANDNWLYIANPYSNELQTINISNPVNPILKGRLTNVVSGALIYGAGALTISKNKVFVASNENHAIEIIDISNLKEPKHFSSIKKGDNNIFIEYPKDIQILNNYAYILNGTRSITTIDVSNLLNPIQTSIIYNEFKDFQYNPPSAVNLTFPLLMTILNNHLYVTNTGNFPGLEVMNISNPAQPKHVTNLVDSIGLKKLFYGPAAISISGNYAFILNSDLEYYRNYRNYGFTGITVADVSDPAHPTHISSLLDDESGERLIGALSMAMSGKYLYIHCQDQEFQRYGEEKPRWDLIKIIDASNPYALKITDSINVSNLPGNELVGGSLYTEKNNLYLYSSNTIKLFDISNPATPVYKTKLDDGETGALLQGPNRIVVEGNIAYVTSNNNNGTLEIIQIYPLKPLIISSATDIGTNSFKANWQVNDGATGYFLDVSTDNFKTFVAGYENKAVGNVTSFSVTDIPASASYQYRIRVTDGYHVSDNSEIISLKTLQYPDFQITSITPQSGYMGTEVTLSGTGFSPDVAQNNVFFAKNMKASVLTAATTTLKVVVPYGALSGKITVKTNERSTTGNEVFTVTQLPIDNYRIQVTNLTCRGNNDGNIAITLGAELGYTLTVTGPSYNKTEHIAGTTHHINNLPAGNYQLAFSIDNVANYTQNFDVTITEPQDLPVFKSGVINGRATYSLSGGTRYIVSHNGQTREISEDLVQISLHRGRNVIRITAESECQGVFEDLVYSNGIGETILFPNPTTGQFSIVIPEGENEIIVEIISMIGSSMLKEKRVVSLNGLINMDISACPNGIYLVKVNGKTVQSVNKVIKK